jgi:formylglycine-generating enzyme required for sulfatase activity
LKRGGVFDLPNHPVVRVTWYEAMAFTRWFDKQVKEKGFIIARFEIRLPTEAEWEKAARGGLQRPEKALFAPLANLVFNPNISLITNENTDRIYPWGDQVNTNHANYEDTGIGNTSAVGCFPGGKSVYGCEEMSGNVFEWCRTQWRESYKDAADEDINGKASRVVRGGSFAYYVRNVRCACRYWDFPGDGLINVGFRVVLSPYF